MKITRPNKTRPNIEFSKNPTRETQVFLHLITGRTLDSSPCFYLASKYSNYLFNAPELTQKQLMANFSRLPSFKGIFITSLYPDSIGGLSHLGLQSLHRTVSIPFSAPEHFKEVILCKTNYVSYEFDAENLNQYSDNEIQLEKIVLSNSVSYKILLKHLQKTILILDVRSLDDISQLPPISEFSTIIHFTNPEILLKSEYTEFFSDKINLCFMNSGIVSNQIGLDYYRQRSNSFLQPLCTGSTLQAPSGFINLTTSHSSYNFIKETVMIEKQHEEIPLSNIDINLPIFPQLIHNEPKIPEFDIYAVTFLGCGTKFVAPHLHLSGYLIHTKYGIIALDPSEGFVYQLRRKYGPINANNILTHLCCIWLSHFHHDHIFGSASLLFERKKVTDKQIYFCAPQPVINDITIISQHYGDFNVVYDNREVNGKIPEDPLSITDQIHTLQINEHLIIQSVAVSHHAMRSKGCRIIIDGKTSIVFSGDRSYNNDYFATLFANPDLLIHEATFPIYARQKIGQQTNHCYIDESIRTSSEMNAKKAVFTHFSQRHNRNDLMYRPSNDIMLGFDFLDFSDLNLQQTFESCSTLAPLGK